MILTIPILQVILLKQLMVGLLLMILTTQFQVKINKHIHLVWIPTILLIKLGMLSTMEVNTAMTLSNTLNIISNITTSSHQQKDKMQPQLDKQQTKPSNLTLKPNRQKLAAANSHQQPMLMDNSIPLNITSNTISTTTGRQEEILTLTMANIIREQENSLLANPQLQTKVQLTSSSQDSDNMRQRLLNKIPPY